MEQKKGKGLVIAPNRVGAQTLVFTNSPRIASYSAIVGDVEGKGNFGEEFDLVLQDDLYGMDTWEHAESKMFEQAVNMALQKAGMSMTWVDCLLGGDLLNQIISASFAARQLSVPFLGLYGACSTMAESLLVGAALISGGFVSCAACTVSSHFSTAERQYRFPLEMGVQRTPTAQRTVTGAGCTVLVSDGSGVATRIAITHGTIGRVIDLGITDVNNMGAAMAPCACDTVCVHLEDTGRSVEYYDLIVTGDLGAHGSDMFLELCKQRGVDVRRKHMDCGDSIFKPDQNVQSGGSGCACSAVVLNGHLIKALLSGAYNRILFLATGALLSLDSSQQGESIPGVAHAVALEIV